MIVDCTASVNSQIGRTISYNMAAPPFGYTIRRIIRRIITTKVGLKHMAV